MFTRFMQLPSAGSRPRRARGFSFVEILFAVAVLGIGFIMLAAIFPVGLQQTKLTLDETTAAANARTAVATLAQLAQVQTQYLQMLPVPQPQTDSNSTYLFPHTYAGPWPVVGNAPGQVPAGQSRTFYGQLRSLRDGRNFCDSWNPAINDPPRPVLAAHEMLAADIAPRRNYIWNRVSSELLTNSNERNAFVVLYKRDVTFSAPLTASALSPADPPKPAESAQIVVINAQVAAQSAYTTNDVISGANPVIYNLEPRPVGVIIKYDNVAGAYIARFRSVKGAAVTPPPGNHTDFNNSGAYDAAPAAVAEGTFILISDDNITTAGSSGRMNGRIFRLGNYRTDLSGSPDGTEGYELAPGFAFTVDPGADGILHKTSGVVVGQPGFNKDDITAIGVTGPLPVEGGGDGSGLNSFGPAVAYVLGKGFDNVNVTPGTGVSGYVGTAQDVALYTTFISVK